MPITAIQLNGTNILATAFERTEVDENRVIRVAKSGAARLVTNNAVKYQFTITSEGIPLANRWVPNFHTSNTIRDYDGTTYTVLLEPGSYQEAFDEQDSVNNATDQLYLSITARFRQV